MHKRICSLILPLLLLACASALALDRQDAPAIRRAVESFLRQETLGLPGQVSWQLGALDERLSLPACAQLEPFVPPGAKLWGNTTLGVRCAGTNAWTIYLPAQVKVIGSYLAAAHTLAAGQVIGAEDVMLRNGELTALPAGVLLQPAQALGKAMVLGLASGEPLRGDTLRAPNVLQSNQPVKVVAKGSGFTVASEGRALSNAADGQTVQVRVPSGQVIAGIARPGPVVELFTAQ